MSNELKIGVVLGVVIVAVLVVLFVGRAPQEQPPGVDITLPTQPPAPEPEPEKQPAPPTRVDQPSAEPVVIVPPASEITPPAPPVVSEPPAPAAPPPPEPELPKPVYHTVVKGDTLSAIAERYYGDARFWNVIYQANRHIITNPNVLQANWKLRIPSPDEVSAATK